MNLTLFQTAGLFQAARLNIAKRPRALANLQAFLDAGGNPDLRLRAPGLTKDRGTMLTVSAAHGWDAAVQSLLAAGADIHAHRDGALWWATRHGYLPIVRRLLAAGADVHAERERALCAALEREDGGLIQILLCHGASAPTAWGRVHEKQKRTVAGLLDAQAAAIPVHQRRALVALAPHRFPAIRSLLAAERRQRQRRIPVHKGGVIP